MSYSFTQFKAVMDVSDISEEAYAFVLKTVFQYVNKVHAIDLSEIDPDDLTEDFVYAMYIHAKYIYEHQVKNVPTVSTVKNPGGGSVSYARKLPPIINSTYRMYSPLDPITLV